MPTANVTMTLPQANRVGAALGLELGLIDGGGAPRSATIPEYEAWLRDITRRLVQGSELRQAHAAVAAPAALDLT